MKHFHYFKTDITEIKLPEKFTFPFYYKPHLLSKIAVKELQDYLEYQTDFEHNFGLSSKQNNLPIGKMFGVLVVKKNKKEIGYLCAFSGKLSDKSLPKQFVPPVFNMRTEGSFYIKGESEIDQINIEIGNLEKNSEYLKAKKNIESYLEKITLELEFQRQKLKLAKKERKNRKKIGEKNLTIQDLKILLKKLEQESFNDQFFYKELNEYYLQKLALLEEKVKPLEDKLKALKKERKEKSNYLQQTLFRKYAFLNKHKELKSLLDIFNNPAVKPPAGSGECSAPKLLQYAFENNLKPISMAEFWWGKSPNSEIRKHKNYYPACQGRCKPILTHMLNGIEMDENLLIQNLSENKKIEIVYEDDVIVIINKPADLLSVPGKKITDSVFTRMKKRFPNATGPLIVHRLDMATSGLLIITKTKDANKMVQNQFIERSVKKRYIALLDGIIDKNEGTIDLPLRVDLDDRPRQLMCYEHGKKGITKWKVLERKNNTTRIQFYPITGRTHQLRVHASHSLGLNTPIIGDDLYGKKRNRLHLHAEFIEFIHPSTKEKISFTVQPEF